jgi:VacB/RNase II family 3'-5' exoribonuclease
MVSHRVAGAPLDFAALRAELEVPGDFTREALDEAGRAAAAPVPTGRDDRTYIPFVTVDPAGSRDLDQAVHLHRRGDGFIVSYAIADVAAFVAPGSALDAETHRRGETLYFPDARVPLHPPVLSEGAASLLLDQVRPAVLWQMQLDGAGRPTSVSVSRALVRSVAQLDYDGVQAMMSAGTLPDALVHLEAVGKLRLALARERHAINLDLPEQQVTGDATTGWTLRERAVLPVEQYNAEISLLTGMCAAQIMLDGRVGILRTVPAPDEHQVAVLRRAAHALGVPWPHGAQPGDVLASLDRSRPKHVAFIEHAVMLLRGASYLDFDGAPPQQHTHAGIGAPYAHVTAPLRRLVDRYATEICLALRAGQPVPDWARAQLSDIPREMAEADQRAHTVDRAVVDMTEAWLLQDRIGQEFQAIVIDANDHAGTVVIDDPPVRARCDGTALPVGEQITVVLAQADVQTRTVRFARR